MKSRVMTHFNSAGRDGISRSISLYNQLLYKMYTKTWQYSVGIFYSMNIDIPLSFKMLSVGLEILLAFIKQSNYSILMQSIIDLSLCLFSSG